MRSPPSHAMAARRIVDLQGVLQTPMDFERRERLAAEQRTIWESIFPEFSFDQIAATTH